MAPKSQENPLQPPEDLHAFAQELWIGVSIDEQQNREDLKGSIPIEEIEAYMLVKNAILLVGRPAAKFDTRDSFDEAVYTEALTGARENPMLHSAIGHIVGGGREMYIYHTGTGFDSDWDRNLD